MAVKTCSEMHNVLAIESMSLFNKYISLNPRILKEKSEILFSFFFFFCQTVYVHMKKIIASKVIFQIFLNLSSFHVFFLTQLVVSEALPIPGSAELLLPLADGLWGFVILLFDLT